MKKIPTIFKKDDKGKYCIPVWNPRASANPFVDWPVELVPLRKFDGTPVFFDGKNWFYRRMVKDSVELPVGKIFLEKDNFSKRSIYWVPLDESYNFKKYFDEALKSIPFDLEIMPGSRKEGYIEGSYELIGPKVNGNPEGLESHKLLLHRNAPQVSNVSLLEIHKLSKEEAYPALKEVLGYLPIEGVVFYSMNRNPAAKLRKKDFDYGCA